VALLNPSPVLVLPVTMWTVARNLLLIRGLSRADLLMRASPPSLRKAEAGTVGSQSDPPADHVLAAFRALHELGLVADQGGDRWAWSGQQPSSFADFSAQLRDAVLAGENHSDVEDAKNGAGSRDLLRALAWFLSKNPAGQPWSFREAYQDSAAGTDDDSRVFVNATRWNGFRYWSIALGLAEVDALSGQGLVSDPTRAVRAVALHCYKVGDAIPVHQFLADLRERLPVLSGGPVATALGIVAPREVLDPATSYSLESGALREWLRLESRADAPDKVLLADLDRRGTRRTVSHVTMTGLIDV
jgi:hypothetical protein